MPKINPRDYEEDNEPLVKKVKMTENKKVRKMKP